MGTPVGSLDRAVIGAFEIAFDGAFDGVLDGALDGAALLNDG